MPNATQNSKQQPSASDRFTTALTQAKIEMEAKRCPVRFAMEMLGDKWTLLIIRDMTLFEACRYGELQQSLGDISTNILANRLKRLTENGLIEKFKDPDDGKSAIYLLTDKGLDLLPVLGHLIRWGVQYDELSALPSRAHEILKNSEGFLKIRRAQLLQQRAQYGKTPS
jgi:DNA-binding HxlR family transcriptional regulator